MLLNEKNELEFQRVHTINIPNNQGIYQAYWSCTLEHNLSSAIVLCSDDEKRKTGYDHNIL